MQKHVKLASGLSALVALIAASASPAHAEWVYRQGGTFVNLRARSTSASIAATGAPNPGTDSSGTVSIDLNVYYDWVQGPNDDPIPPILRYKVAHKIDSSGAVTANLYEGATGEGKSQALIDIRLPDNEVVVAAYNYSDVDGTIHRLTPDSMPSYVVACDNFEAVKNPYTQVYSLNVKMTVKLANYSVENNQALVEAGQPGPRGGQPGPDVIHNPAPGSANTSASSLVSNDFTLFPF